MAIWGPLPNLRCRQAPRRHRAACAPAYARSKPHPAGLAAAAPRSVGIVAIWDTRRVAGPMAAAGVRAPAAGRCRCASSFPAGPQRLAAAAGAPQALGEPRSRVPCRVQLLALCTAAAAARLPHLAGLLQPRSSLTLVLAPPRCPASHQAASQWRCSGAQPPVQQERRGSGGSGSPRAPTPPRPRCRRRRQRRAPTPTRSRPT